MTACEMAQPEREPRSQHRLVAGSKPLTRIAGQQLPRHHHVACGVKSEAVCVGLARRSDVAGRPRSIRRSSTATDSPRRVHRARSALAASAAAAGRASAASSDRAPAARRPSASWADGSSSPPEPIDGVFGSCRLDEADVATRPLRELRRQESAHRPRVDRDLVEVRSRHGGATEPGSVRRRARRRVRSTLGRNLRVRRVR